MDAKELDEILNICIEKIEDRSKIHRKDGLSDYYSTLFEPTACDFPDGFSIENRLHTDIKVLSRALADDSELNRLKVTEIFIQYLMKNAFIENNVVYIITAISARICHQFEESEDVRKELLVIINLIINMFGSKILPYKSDLYNVLMQLLREKSPDNLRMACDCISAYFTAVKEKGECSLNLLRLLKKVTFHQRYKVREAALKALGCIGTWSSSGNIMEITQCFAQHADDIPHIRITIIKVASKISCHMPDRYSYWHYILPCILLWLRDTDPGARETALRHFSAVGAQYLSENEEMLQQQLQNDCQPDPYPPKAGTRLNLGCRQLAQHILHKVLPGVAGDLRDWQSSSRVATMKLLSALVVLGEYKLQQYASDIVRLLDLALRDSENSVVMEACVCAENLGYFLLPEVSIPAALEMVRASSEALCRRSVKLLELLCMGCPAAQLRPRAAPAVDAVTSLSSLPCDAVVQDDVLAFVGLLLDKNCVVPRLERSSSSKSQINFKDEVVLVGSESGLANASSGSHDVAEMYDRVNVVADSVPENSVRLNGSDCMLSAEKLSTSIACESSVRSNLDEDGYALSFELLKCLLLVIGSNICEVNVTRAQQLVHSLARTCTQNSESEILENRANSVVGHQSSNETNVNCFSRASDGADFPSSVHENGKTGQTDGALQTPAGRPSSSHADKFFQLHAGRLLEQFLSGCELWTPDDPQFFTASAFLSLAGQSIHARDAGRLVSLYTRVFSAEVDSLVLVRLLSALDKILQCPHQSLRPRPQRSALIAQMLDGFMYKLLDERCCSREAQLLRSGALEVLACAVAAASGDTAFGVPTSRAPDSGGPTSEGPDFGDPDSLVAGLVLVLKAIPKLLHDDLVDTRAHALRLTGYCAVHYSPAVGASGALAALATGVLERLDENVRDVRVLAAGALSSLLTCVQIFRSKGNSSNCPSPSMGSDTEANISIPKDGDACKEEVDVETEDAVQDLTSPAADQGTNADAGVCMGESSAANEIHAPNFDEFEENIRRSLSRILLFLDDPDETMALAVAECCKKLSCREALVEGLQEQRGRQHVSAHCPAIVEDLLRGVGC